MATEDLNSILNGTSEATPAEEAPAEAAPVAEAAPERPRDEHGRFLPKGDNEPQAAEPAAEPSATPAPEDDSPTVPRKALIDERNKRQTLEGQLEEVNRRLASMTPQVPTQQPQVKPDQWDDPEGHERWLIEQAGGVAEQRAVVAFQRQHVIMSAEAAKAKYPDYLEKVDVFERLSTENPGLSAQMFSHPSPAEFAYQTAKTHEEVSQYGSLDEWKAAEKVKWEAEALERLKATLPSNAPPTLSTERNVGSRSGPAWSGPKPLGELLQ